MKRHESRIAKVPHRYCAVTSANTSWNWTRGNVWNYMPIKFQNCNLLAAEAWTSEYVLATRMELVIMPNNTSLDGGIGDLISCWLKCDLWRLTNKRHGSQSLGKTQFCPTPWKKFMSLFGLGISQELLSWNVIRGILEQVATEQTHWRQQLKKL